MSPGQVVGWSSTDMRNNWSRLWGSLDITSIFLSASAMEGSDCQSSQKVNTWLSAMKEFLKSHSCAYRTLPPKPVSSTPATLGITPPTSPWREYLIAPAQRTWSPPTTNTMTSSLSKAPGILHCVGTWWLNYLISRLAKTKKTVPLTVSISQKLQDHLW